MKIDKKIIKTLFITSLLLISVMPVFISTVQASPLDIINEKWYFKIRDYAPETYWDHNSSWGSSVTPVAANLDDDSQLEVIVSAGYNNINANFWGVVVCVDGDMSGEMEIGDEMWSFSEDYLGNHCCVELGDINNDGDLEAILSGYAQIVAVHAENGTEIWRYTRPEVSSYLDKPTILADIDGITYLYHAIADDSNNLAIRKVYASNGTEVTRWDTADVGCCKGGLSAADINNDGKLEILLPSTSSQGGLMCFDEDLNLLWQHTDITCSGGTPVLRDVNDDGYLDVIVLCCSSGNGWIGIVDGRDGSKINWPGSSMGLYAHDGPTTYDIDGDGDIEVFTQIAGQNKIQVWDITNWRWETNLTEANVTTSNQNVVLANVYGDNSLEIIHSSNGNDWNDRGMRFWSNDYSFIGQETTMYSHQFIVYDVDDDGKNEIIGIGTRDGFGGFVQCCDTNGDTLGARLENMYYSERRNPVEEYVEGLIQEPEPESETEGVTRIISAAHDNYYTFIRNSNGKYWEATTENIQVAINDLGNNGGTVWLPGNKSFIFTETLIVREKVTLNMGGCSFEIAEGYDFDMVDMRDGSAIIDGNIDVALQDGYTAYTSFDAPHAAILIDASNCIDSLLIKNMNLESFGHEGYSPRLGRGYGIYLHAIDTNVPQRISNVTVEGVYLRCFENGIRIENERNPGDGEHGAIIDGNTFLDISTYALSYMINITRNTEVPRSKCSASNNTFMYLLLQPGNSSWYGDADISWQYFYFDGYGNSIKYVTCWDWAKAYGSSHGKAPGVLSSDSSHCCLMGRTQMSYVTNDGTDNILFNFGSSELTLNNIVELG